MSKLLQIYWTYWMLIPIDLDRVVIDNNLNWLPIFGLFSRPSLANPCVWIPGHSSNKIPASRGAAMVWPWCSALFQVHLRIKHIQTLPDILDILLAHTCPKLWEFSELIPAIFSASRVMPTNCTYGCRARKSAGLCCICRICSTCVWQITVVPYPL